MTANLGDMLDFFDFFLIGYVLAFILKDWHITYGQSALILVSAGLGAVPGAFFWGWMGDRIGRRTVFIADRAQCRDRHRASCISRPTRTPGSRAGSFLVFFRFFVGFGNAGHDRGRHPAGAGIRAGLQARLGQRPDDRAAAGRQCAGRDLGRVSSRR